MVHDVYLYDNADDAQDSLYSISVFPGSLVLRGIGLGCLGLYNVTLGELLGGAAPTTAAPAATAASTPALAAKVVADRRVGQLDGDGRIANVLGLDVVYYSNSLQTCASSASPAGRTRWQSRRRQSSSGGGVRRETSRTPA